MKIKLQSPENKNKINMCVRPMASSRAGFAAGETGSGLGSRGAQRPLAGVWGQSPLK